MIIYFSFERLVRKKQKVVLQKQQLKQSYLKNRSYPFIFFCKSNDYIFGSIIDNFDYINEGDIVIINMTLHGRIEVPIGDEIINALSSYENEMKIRGYNDGGDRQEKIETIINFQYHFSNHQFYKDRHIKRFNFIKNRLLNEKKVKYVYLWSLEEVDSGIYSSFDTIYKATNGKVEDRHFSFNGHLNFAHYLYNTVRDKKQII